MHGEEESYVKYSCACMGMWMYFVFTLSLAAFIYNLSEYKLHDYKYDENAVWVRVPMFKYP